MNFLKKFINKMKIETMHFFYMHIIRSPIKYARKLGVKVGDDCQFIDDPKDIFNSEPWLIKVGNHVRITYGVRILTHEGAIWNARVIDNRYKNSSTYEPVVIGNNVTIGMYSIIMPGVKVGNNVVIGAHSVVTRDVGDNQIVAGCPAKKISDMNTFLKKMEKRELFNILDMSAMEKRKYIEKCHSEWFI